MCLSANYKKKKMKKIFFAFLKELDPDPHQNVTDPQHWLAGFYYRYIDLEYQHTEKIETEVRDFDRIRKHTGVRNIVQSSVLGHPLHTLSYRVLFPPC